MIDTSELSQQAHDRFAANVQAVTEQQRLSGTANDPNTGLPPGQEHPSQMPAPTINQKLLQTAADMQAQTDEHGIRLYVTDSAHRERTEAVRRQAYGGPAVPVAETQPQAPTEPVVGEGSPEDRAAATVQELLDSGDIVEAGNVDEATFSKLTAGYNLRQFLPQGFGIDATAAEQLYAARQAGLTESQVQSIVAHMVKAQKT